MILQKQRIRCEYKHYRKIVWTLPDDGSVNKKGISHQISETLKKMRYRSSGLRTHHGGRNGITEVHKTQYFNEILTNCFQFRKKLHEANNRGSWPQGLIALAFIFRRRKVTCRAMIQLQTHGGRKDSAWVQTPLQFN